MKDDDSTSGLVTRELDAFCEESIALYYSDGRGVDLIAESSKGHNQTTEHDESARHSNKAINLKDTWRFRVSATSKQLKQKCDCAFQKRVCVCVWCGWGKPNRRALIILDRRNILGGSTSPFRHRRPVNRHVTDSIFQRKDLVLGN